MLQKIASNSINILMENQEHITVNPIPYPFKAYISPKIANSCCKISQVCLNSLRIPFARIFCDANQNQTSHILCRIQNAETSKTDNNSLKNIMDSHRQKISSSYCRNSYTETRQYLETYKNLIQLSGTHYTPKNAQQTQTLLIIESDCLYQLGLHDQASRVLNIIKQNGSYKQQQHCLLLENAVKTNNTQLIHTQSQLIKENIMNSHNEMYAYMFIMLMNIKEQVYANNEDIKQKMGVEQYVKFMEDQILPLVIKKSVGNNGTSMSQSSVNKKNGNVCGILVYLKIAQQLIVIEEWDRAQRALMAAQLMSNHMVAQKNYPIFNMNRKNWQQAFHQSRSSFYLDDKNRNRKSQICLKIAQLSYKVQNHKNMIPKKIKYLQKIIGCQREMYGTYSQIIIPTLEILVNQLHVSKNRKGQAQKYMAQLKKTRQQCNICIETDRYSSQSSSQSQSNRSKLGRSLQSIDTNIQKKNNN